MARADSPSGKVRSITGVSFPASRRSRRTPRSALFRRARKKTIRWLTTGDSNAIVTERPSGPIQCPLFGYGDFGQIDANRTP